MLSNQFLIRVKECAVPCGAVVLRGGSFRIRRARLGLNSSAGARPLKGVNRELLRILPGGGSESFEIRLGLSGQIWDLLPRGSKWRIFELLHGKKKM